MIGCRLVEFRTWDELLLLCSEVAHWKRRRPDQYVEQGDLF